MICSLDSLEAPAPCLLCPRNPFCRQRKLDVAGLPCSSLPTSEEGKARVSVLMTRCQPPPALFWPDARAERLGKLGRDWVFLRTSPALQARRVKALLSDLLGQEAWDPCHSYPSLPHLTQLMGEGEALGDLRASLKGKSLERYEACP